MENLNLFPDLWWHRLHTTARVVTVALALLFLDACKKWDDNQTSQDRRLPQEGQLSNLLELPVNKTDKEEITNYSILLADYQKIQKDIDTLKNTPWLSDLLGNIVSFDKMLPLWIKESHLDPNALSRTGARGTGQLQGITIETIDGWLKTYWITTKYQPKSNNSHNILYSILHMSHAQQEIKKYVKWNVSDEDAFLFALAAYNMGISRRKVLYDASGKVGSRDDFVKYIIKTLMNIPYKKEQGTDPVYKVAYNNYFQDKNYSGDQTVVFKDKATGIEVTKSKIQEFIRYVEILRWLEKSLTKDQKDYAEIKIVLDTSLYTQVSVWIKKQQKEAKIKDWQMGELLQNILLDNQITISGVEIFPEKLVVNESIIVPYLVDQEFGKYQYRVEKYIKNGEKKFLWSIIGDLMEDEKFSKTIEKIRPEMGEETINDMTGTIRTYLQEAIIRFNQELRMNRSPTSSNDVRIPEDTYFLKYEDLQTLNTVVRETQIAQQEESVRESIEEQISTGKFYADKSLDEKGKQCLEKPKAFTVTKLYNPILADAEKANKTSKPNLIIVHWTEDSEKQVNGPRTVKAHFYIDPQGNIYQYTALRGNQETWLITSPAEIVKLNHAWKGREWDYWFLWEGDSDGTYRAIGIEVATTVIKWKKTRPNDTQHKSLKQLLAWLSSTYNIPQKNILTHLHVAERQHKRYKDLKLRWRKTDLWGLDPVKIGIPYIYQRLDPDVIAGKTCPNMLALYNEHRSRGMGKQEIKKVLSGLNASIILCRKDSKVRNNRVGKEFISEWGTLEELEKKGLLN